MAVRLDRGRCHRVFASSKALRAWRGATEALLELDGATWRVHPMPRDMQTVPNQSSALAVLHDGRVWLRSDRPCRIEVLDRDGFHDVPAPSDRGLSEAPRAARGPRRQRLVRDDDPGRRRPAARCVDGDALQRAGPVAGAPDRDRRGPQPDAKDGTIWMASGSGVHRRNGDVWITNGEADGLPADAALKVFEDSRGRIWAGTGRGLSLFHADADRDPPRVTLAASNLTETPPDGDVTLAFSGSIAGSTRCPIVCCSRIGSTAAPGRRSGHRHRRPGREAEADLRALRAGRPIDDETGVQGPGTAFHFTARFGAAGAPARAADARAEAPLRPLQVLVAEDNPVNQVLATKLLQKLGHTVVTASSGTEALCVLDGVTVGVILMDVQMPEMDGFEATAAIRQREAGGPRVPIVALTAHALQGYREQCLQAGMDYLTKPITLDALSAALTRVAGAAADAA